MSIGVHVSVRPLCTCRTRASDVRRSRSIPDSNKLHNPHALTTGVKAGKYTDFATLPADTVDAMKAGMKDAYTFIFDPANAAKARTPCDPSVCV